jgi:hypothetical protein
MEGPRLKHVLRATMLALLGAVVLAPTAPAQTSFEVTVQFAGDAGDLRIPSLTANASVPDISSEALLSCMDASASCLDEVWSLGAPQTETPAAPSQAPRAATSSRGSSPPARSRAPAGRRSQTERRPREPPATPAQRTVESRRPVGLRESGPPPPPPDRARPRPLDASPRGVEPLPSRPPALSLAPPASGLDVDGIRFVAALLLATGTLSLLLLALGAAPRGAAARVAYQLADRRREVSLLGGVMLMGVAVGYLTAVFAG